MKYIVEYNEYDRRQVNARLKEKFFEFVMFLKSFYKEHLDNENQKYSVKSSEAGREFYIMDYSKGMTGTGGYYNEWQFTITYFASIVEEKSNRIEINFSKNSSNDYTKALEEMIKDYSYKIKNYHGASGYYLRENQIDAITLNIDQYVAVKKYNL